MLKLAKHPVFLVCDCGFRVYSMPVIKKIAKRGFNCPKCKEILYVGN